MQSGPYREASPAPPPPVAAWREWPWGHAVVALLFPCTGLAHGLPFAQLIIFMGLFVMVLVLALWALPYYGWLRVRERRSEARAHARISCVWLASVAATVIVIVVIVGADRRHERTSAEAVSGAVERFRADRGEYPAQLGELVPRYLPRIPSPHRQSGEGCSFLYERGERGVILGRLVYQVDFQDCNTNDGDVYDFARRWVWCSGTSCPTWLRLDPTSR